MVIFVQNCINVYIHKLGTPGPFTKLFKVSIGYLSGNRLPINSFSNDFTSRIPRFCFAKFKSEYRSPISGILTVLRPIWNKESNVNDWKNGSKRRRVSKSTSLFKCDHTWRLFEPFLNSLRCFLYFKSVLGPLILCKHVNTVYTLESISDIIL